MPLLAFETAVSRLGVGFAYALLHGVLAGDQRIQRIEKLGKEH